MKFSKKFLVELREGPPGEGISASYLMVRLAIISSIDLQVVLILRLHCLAVDHRALPLEGSEFPDIPVVFLLHDLAPDTREAALFVIFLGELGLLGNADSFSKQAAEPQVFNRQFPLLIGVSSVLQVID